MDHKLAPVSIFRPVFKEKYWVENVPGEGYFLVSENASFVLEGSNLEHVIPLIDGQHTTDEIVRLASAHIEPHDALATVTYLAERGHIREADPFMPPEVAAFWTELGVDTRDLPALFASMPVQVVTLTEDPHPNIFPTMFAFGWHAAPVGRVLLVIVDDYLDPRLEEINRACLQNRTPWLLFKPDGVNIWVGPLFIPHQTACWTCIASRLNDNREVESHIRARTNRAGPLPTTRARLWTSRQQAYSMAVTQLTRWLVTGTNPVLESNIVISETVSFAFSYHPTVRRPQCASCGDPQLLHTTTSSFHFHERRPSHVVDGGERHEAPEVTLDRYSHHISPVTGIVRGLNPSPWNRVSPLRSYAAGHNFSLKNGSLYFLKEGLRTHSSGKGRTDAQAKTSALCEALERYSGIFTGDEPRTRASFREMGDEAIHPNSCMLFSETQYTERQKWLSRRSRFQIVPMPFDESASVEWSPIYSFTEKRTKYLPTSYLYYGYPHDGDAFYGWADSNGNASGSTLEDACLQGFYELVERDAVGIWWYNQVRRPQLALESLGDSYVSELREFYETVGREFWLLDLTTDLGIPVFAAVSRRISAPTEDIVMGFGAHMDVRIAASRALTEMNQFMPAVLNVDSNGITHYGIDDTDAVSWWRTATIFNQPYLMPLTTPSDKRLNDYPPPESGGILQRLMASFSIVENLGMEVLLLNQTRPDVGLSVVKVIIPGIRHFWARFAPGRLYDVPVQLGWLKVPTAEEHLNPIPMFL